ncbi:MAG: efflux RND transporter periplasmic adaptor subunit [Planctomycetota bacterium]
MQLLSRGRGGAALALLGWLGLASVLPGCGDPPAEDTAVRPVLAFQVPEDDAFEMRRFSGRAQASNEVNLSFRVSGPLLDLPVDVGDTVTQGQTVAQIDPNDFRLRVQNVEAQLKEARIRLELAKEESERIKEAFEGGAASELENMEGLANREGAAAQVAALEASLQSAKDELAYTTLAAPFAGRVVAKYVDNFQNVQAQEPVLRLLDDETIEMVIDIPESLIGLVKREGEGFATFESLPGVVLPARIKEIGTEASEVTRTYPLTLSIPQPEGDARILPGMTGQSWGKRPPVPTEYHLVPVSAIFEDAGERWVWTLTPQPGGAKLGTATKRAVELGETLSRGVQVKGLQTGEWVAVAGVHYLKEGQSVRIQGEPAVGTANAPEAQTDADEPVAPEPADSTGVSGASGDAE